MSRSSVVLPEPLRPTRPVRPEPNAPESPASAAVPSGQVKATSSRTMEGVKVWAGMSLLGVVDALTPRRPRGRLGRMPEPEAAEIDVSARIRAQTRVGVVLVTDGGV